MVDGLLMLGFGGPTPGCCERRRVCPREAGCEAECFVSGILGDNPGRARRVAQVVEHYQRLGGFSPYNALTERQAEALRGALDRHGRPLQVACGFRHWRPWATDGLLRLHQAGCREVGLLVMAPHQSSVSWDWYLTQASEASDALGDRSPRLVGVVEPWWHESGFVSAIVARLTAAVAGWDPDRRSRAGLVFTAHAIPQPVAATAPYAGQFAETARLAATAFGHSDHRVAYQSQPADSAIPWSGPDILSVIDELHAEGVQDVLVCAAGFLVDHTEVLYDLDIEARERAREHGMSYTRARSVEDHPDFIAMLAKRVINLST